MRFLSPEGTLIFKHVAPAGWSLGRTPVRPPLTPSEDALAPGSEKGISNFQLSPAGDWLWMLLISIYTSPLATAKKREEGSWPSACGIGHSLSKYRAGMSGGGTGYKSHSGSPLALLWAEESGRPARFSSVCGSEDHPVQPCLAVVRLVRGGAGSPPPTPHFLLPELPLTLSSRAPLGRIPLDAPGTSACQCGLTPLICAEAVGSPPPAPTLPTCTVCLVSRVPMISRPQWLVSVCQFETSPCSQKSEGA